jgi:hypothetical protein
MSEAEIQAAAERLAWEAEFLGSGVFLLLYGGSSVVEAINYDPAVHGALANCLSCKRPTDACSWIQNPAAGRGDCCDDCRHAPAVAR